MQMNFYEHFTTASKAAHPIRIWSWNCVLWRVLSTYQKWQLRFQFCQRAGRQPWREHPEHTAPTQKPETPGRRSTWWRQTDLQPTYCGHFTPPAWHYIIEWWEGITHWLLLLVAKQKKVAHIFIVNTWHLSDLFNCNYQPKIMMYKTSKHTVQLRF